MVIALSVTQIVASRCNASGSPLLRTAGKGIILRVLFTYILSAQLYVNVRQSANDTARL